MLCSRHEKRGVFESRVQSGARRLMMSSKYFEFGKLRASLASSGAAVLLLALACTQARPAAPSGAPAAPAPLQAAPIARPADQDHQQTAPPSQPAAVAPVDQAKQPQAVLGPTTALLERLGADTKSMGIKLSEERDASGPPAYEIRPGDLLVYTNASADYAATTKADRLVVIDAKTKTIRHTQDVNLSAQGKPANGHMIGVSPSAEYIYLPNRNDNNMFVLDLRTLKTKQVLDLGGRAHHLNVLNDRYMLGDAFKGNGVAGIYLLDPAEGNRGAGGVPRGDFGGEPYLAFPDPTNTFLYVSVDPRVRKTPDGREDVPAWFSQIDLKTWGEIRTIPVGPNPIWAVFSRDGTYAYLTISVTSRVEKIEVATGKKVGEAPTGRGPYGAVLSADEKFLYVVSKGEGGNGQRGATFARIATGTMGLDVELPTSPVQPNQPDHVLLSPDGTELWISNNMGSITVFDQATLALKAFIEMPDKGAAHGVAFVQFDENGNGKVVMDLLGPHGGVSPYLYDQSIGRAQPYGSPSGQARVASKQAAPESAAVQQPAAAVGELLVFDIAQMGNSFQPGSVTVKAGAPVRFRLRNDDAEEHNIVSTQIKFPQNQQHPGETQTVDWVAPSQPGTYDAFCTFHAANMWFKIVVQ